MSWGRSHVDVAVQFAGWSGKQAHAYSPAVLGE